MVLEFRYRVRKLVRRARCVWVLIHSGHSLMCKVSWDASTLQQPYGSHTVSEARMPHTRSDAGRMAVLLVTVSSVNE
jgi:hypothetical protein